MNKDDLFIRLKNKFYACRNAKEDWYTLAKEAYSLYHGDQWCKQDIESLKCKGRPYLTFNQVMPLINSVIGSEINNRRTIKYIPREVGDVKSNELLSSVADWFRNEANGAITDTEIFKDSLITGMGWGEITLDYANSLSGKPVIKRLDPFKMVWDADAALSNITDAKYLFYINTLPLETLKLMFPRVEEHEFWIDDKNEDALLESSDQFNEKVRDFGTVIEARYKELDKVITYFDVFSKKEVTVPIKEYKNISKKYFEEYGIELTGFEHYQEVVRRAFLGSTKILEEVDSPLAPNGHFGWVCMTGYFDNINKRYYGLVKSIKDAQLCINKFFSEAVYNMNSQGKGGLFVEKGAVDNFDEFRSTVNFVDELTILNNGGLNKIQPKPSGQISPALSSLLNFSEGQMSRVTGISQEFLGTREINQPGVLEAHRKQSSLNILAPLFDNLKMYRKMQGEIILYLIQNYLSDGRLVRILGNDKEQYVSLIKEEVSNKEYDIIIEDQPLAFNDSERNFQIITQLLPMIQQFMTPDIMLEIMRHSPLPSDLVDGLRNAYTKQQQLLEQQQKQTAAIQQQQFQKEQQESQLRVQKEDMKDALDNQKKAAEINKINAQAVKEYSLAEKHNLDSIQEY